MAFDLLGGIGWRCAGVGASRTAFEGWSRSDACAVTPFHPSLPRQALGEIRHGFRHHVFIDFCCPYRTPPVRSLRSHRR